MAMAGLARPRNGMDLNLASLWLVISPSSKNSLPFSERSLIARQLLVPIGLFGNVALTAGMPFE